MNTELAKQIVQMAKVDQDLRFAALKAQKGSSGLTPYNYLVYVVDTIHGFRIHQIIKDHGYPTKKQVGVKALKTFWLLVQHQDFDVQLQKKCLENCDFAKTEREHLTDRVLINSGKKQRYGTQFHSKKNFKKRKGRSVRP